MPKIKGTKLAKGVDKLEDELGKLSKRHAKERAVCLSCPLPTCAYDYGGKCELLGGGTTTRTRKPVEQYTLDGVFIKKWRSTGEASLALDVREGGIRKAAQRNGTSHGFVWRYSR